MPTTSLAVAISEDSRSAFVLHLMDVDAAVPGWADECVKRALYTQNKHFFLREMIKRGFTPAVAGTDFFRVAAVSDPTGESLRLLLKAGYKPDETVMDILVNNVGKGVLGQAPAIIAALPKAKRSDALARTCARGVLGDLSEAALDRLAKQWKGKPAAEKITFHISQEAFRATRSHEDVAHILQTRGWLDTGLVPETARDHPLMLALQACADHDSLAQSSSLARSTARPFRI